MSQIAICPCRDNIVSVDAWALQKMRSAVRRKSLNPSITNRLYDEGGICYYCVTCHESFHGHGYVVEYELKGKEVIITITPDDAALPPIIKQVDATRWKKTQRKELIENCAGFSH